MADTKLLIMSEVKENRQRILAPAAGYYSDLPQNGAFLIGGSLVGKLKILNSYYDLHLPGDIYGQVWAKEETDFVIPVEYGQELFQLNPDKTLVQSGKEETKADTEAEGIDASPDEGYIVKAFTTGIFYAKPSPDSPAFVTEGQEIEKGKALGLIEVMKTFNHIIFHGTDDSDTGKIKKIYVKDSQEVKLGQPLFLIE